MSSYEDRFVKIGVVFHGPYFENEVGDQSFFLGISDIGNSLSYSSKSMKDIYAIEDFRANVLNWEKFVVILILRWCQMVILRGFRLETAILFSLL